MFIQGQVEQWIDFSSLEIDSKLMGWLYPRFGYANYIAPVSYYLTCEGIYAWPYICLTFFYMIDFTAKTSNMFIAIKLL